MMNDANSIDWLDIWLSTFEIGMLITAILFILKVFESFNIYKYYYRFFKGILSLLFLWTFLGVDGMFYGWRYIDIDRVYFITIFIFSGLRSVIGANLITIAPATYQYRKKAGILRRTDPPLFCGGLILCVLYIHNNMYIYNDLSIFWF